MGCKGSQWAHYLVCAFWKDWSFWQGSRLSSLVTNESISSIFAILEESRRTCFFYGSFKGGHYFVATEKVQGTDVQVKATTEGADFVCIWISSTTASTNLSHRLLRSPAFRRVSRQYGVYTLLTYLPLSTKLVYFNKRNQSKGWIARCRLGCH